LAKKDRL